MVGPRCTMSPGVGSCGNRCLLEILTRMTNGPPKLYSVRQRQGTDTISAVSERKQSIFTIYGNAFQKVAELQIADGT